MLEWLTSKIVISVAALVILASVGGFLAVQTQVWEDEELRNVAKEISGTVNDISTIQAETVVFLSFGDDGNGLSVKASIGGDHYDVEVFRDMVRCKQGDRRSASFFYHSIHLYPPSMVDRSNMTAIRSMDLELGKLDTTSTGKMIIMRVLVGDLGSQTFETFLFLGD